MKPEHNLLDRTITASYPVIITKDRLDDIIDRKVFLLDYLEEHINVNLHRTIYQGVLTNIDEFINGTTI